MAKKKLASLYSVHPGVAYYQAMIDNLPKKTGRSLDNWIKLIKKDGPAAEKERKDWLKKEHKIGGNTAGLIAERADGKNVDLTDAGAYLKVAAEYVENMYSGGKSELRPIHDALIELGFSLGADVKVSPCKTIVPLYRNHVFAEIKPSTKTRVDLGLYLRDCKKKLPKRIIDTGGLAKKDRITHRIPISSLDEIDKQVKDWLKIAYELVE